MVDWQQHYESGNTPWDKGSPAPPLVQWLERNRVNGKVLVPGCGTGHDLLPLAAGGAEEVTGLDIAPGAVAGAAARIGGHPQITARLGDFFAAAGNELSGQFDWIFEHTCFCAIDRGMRDAYVAAAAAALKPGGSLLAIFYLRPWESDEDQDQGPPFGTSTEELDRRFGGQFSVIESYVPDVSYPGREGRELVRVLRRNS